MCVYVWSMAGTNNRPTLTMPVATVTEATMNLKNCIMTVGLG